MNNANGGKPPMDQRKMAGYGSGISGVTIQPPNNILGQQGMTNTAPSAPTPNNLNIGKMPATPRISQTFGTNNVGPTLNAPNYDVMAQGPMVVAPIGKTSLKNKAKSGLKKAKPLIIFTGLAGITYLALRTLGGRRSARRGGVSSKPEKVGEIEDRSGWAEIYSEGGKTYYIPTDADGEGEKIRITQKMLNHLHSNENEFDGAITMSQIVGSHGPNMRFQQYLRDIGKMD
jgi:hypothetical protein